MAQIRPSYDTNRTDLSKIIPLDSPFSIVVEPTRTCNLKCFYCIHATRGIPGGVLERTGVPVKHMDMDVWDKIVRDIMEFPEQPKRITFAGLGEPLMNPNLGEMIRTLRAAGYNQRCDIITNGVLITPERSNELVDAGVTKFIISVQGMTGERYKELCGVAIDMDKYISNIRWLFEHKKSTEIYIKIIDANLRNEEEKRIFFETFDSICDTMFVEHLMTLQQQTAEFRSDSGIGTKLNLYGEPHANLSVCPAIFYVLQIMSDASVYPCMPPGLPSNFSIGNCKGESSLKEIWNGKTRYSLLKRMLKVGMSQIPVCEKCDCIQSAAYDNIDDRAEEILARLEGMENVRD